MGIIREFLIWILILLIVGIGRLLLRIDVFERRLARIAHVLRVLMMVRLGRVLLGMLRVVAFILLLFSADRV